MGLARVLRLPAAAAAAFGAANTAAVAVLDGSYVDGSYVAPYVAPLPAAVHAEPPRLLWLLDLLATAACAAVTFLVFARFDPRPLLAWVNGVDERRGEVCSLLCGRTRLCRFRYRAHQPAL